MPYSQRDLVMVKLELPDGKILSHPYLIISCRSSISIENHYTGVLLTHMEKEDLFTFQVDKNMFESSNTDAGQLRLHILASFRHVQVTQFMNRMKKPHFINVINRIKEYLLCIDN